MDDDIVGLRLPSVLVVGVALAFAAVVNTVVVLDDIRSGREGQIGLDTAAATIGLLLAYLLFGRFRASRMVRDLLLCQFLLLLGASNAVFSAIPRSFGSVAQQGASGVAGLVAGVLFVAATWLPARYRWRWSSRWAAIALGASTVLVLALCVIVGSALPSVGSGSVDTFGATTDVSLTATAVVTAGLFAIAGYGAA